MHIGFLGCGNMGEAFLKAMLKKGVLEPSETTVMVKSPEKLHRLEDLYRVKITQDVRKLQELDILFLAVKPQNLSELDLYPRPGMIIISILAGVKVKTLKTKFKNTKIVRCMPNIAQIVGEGMTGIYFDEEESFSPEEMKQVESLLSSGAQIIPCKQERDLDAITAVSGSGPAYVLTFTQALQEGAEALGIPSKEAERLARQTVIGAAKILEQYPDDTVDEWCTKVASKGGTTEEALKILDKKSWRKILQQALEAAEKKAQVLGNDA